MPLIPFVAMVRKDLQLFFSDRRSVIISFVVPIAIGSFFGAVFGSGGQNREPFAVGLSQVCGFQHGRDLRIGARRSLECFGQGVRNG